MSQMNRPTQTFAVWFEYEEVRPGIREGGFQKKFEAYDADDAQRQAREWAANQRAKQQGIFHPVYVNSAFSMTDRDFA